MWHTLNNGELTEIFYPDLGTPSVRDMQLIVSDDKTFAERETDATTQRVELADARSLTYRQINTAKSGRYRITKTYVTDRSANALLVDVRFESLTGKPYRVYALYDASLNNDANDDSGTSGDGRVQASDGAVASALLAAPAFGKASTGYLGTSDGWTDVRGDFHMDWNYGRATSGNVVQTARTALNGTDDQRVVRSLGFGGSQDGALAAASNAHVVQLMQQVEDGGGCLTLNWHPEYLNIPKYWDVHRTVLEEGHRRSAWGCSLREVYAWWTERGRTLRRPRPVTS